MNNVYGSGVKGLCRTLELNMGPEPDDAWGMAPGELSPSLSSKKK